MMPWWCAASRAVAIWAAIAHASASAIGPAAMRSASVLPANELEDQRVRRPAVLEAVDVADIRMADRGQHFGFALEAGQPIGIRATSTGRILSATSRLSLLSRAR